MLGGYNVRKFDTNVQELKYKVLREIARLAKDDKLAAGIPGIPETIVPGPVATMRCCIYKDRAIIKYRLMALLGASYEAETDESKTLKEYLNDALYIPGMHR